MHGISRNTVYRGTVYRGSTVYTYMYNNIHIGDRYTYVPFGAGVVGQSKSSSGSYEGSIER